MFEPNAESVGNLQLSTIDARLFVYGVLPFQNVHSVLSLSGTCRHFRQLLRDETVWRMLHARDHPFLTHDTAFESIGSQFLLLPLGVQPTPVHRLREARDRLLAVQSLLMETHVQSPIIYVGKCFVSL